MIKTSKVDFRAYSDSYISSLRLLSVLRNDRHGRSVEKVMLSDFLEAENVCLNFLKKFEKFSFLLKKNSSERCSGHSLEEID